MLKIFSFILILLSLNCYSEEPVFSFSIFSDNTGDGPERVEFSRMVDFIKAEGHPFVLGMGDHVKRGTKNKFIEFVKSDDWWQKHFYPTIADNDNEFYGKDQADWGVGKALFDLTDIKTRSNVFFIENGSEYYAVIEHEGIMIHFISLHYPDQPKDDSVSFREDSKEFMVKTLKSIVKTGSDIVIVGAHSRLGYWLDKLNSEQKKVVMEKADLVLSATTHVFNIYSEAGSDGPLAINTGSITRPRLWSPHGFVAVDVFSDPLRFEINYINCSKEKPERPKLFFRASKTVGKRISAQ
jgi:predicted phosphodiesterase